MQKQKINKEKILFKAMIHFKNYGYKNTSIGNLAEEFKIQKSHFYYYFKNKEELMLEVLLLSKQILNLQVMALAYDESIPIEQRIKKCIDRLRFFFTYENGGCIMANTILETAHLRDNGFKGVIREFFEETITILTYLANHFNDEKLSKHIADFTIQDVEGSLILMKTFEDQKYLDLALKRAELNLLGKDWKKHI